MKEFLVYGSTYFHVYQMTWHVTHSKRYNQVNKIMFKLLFSAPKLQLYFQNLEIENMNLERHSFYAILSTCQSLSNYLYICCNRLSVHMPEQF